MWEYLLLYTFCQAIEKASVGKIIDIQIELTYGIHAERNVLSNRWR